MAEPKLEVWRTLFGRALQLVDSVRAAGVPFDDWTFGGGTVLMLRHKHRLSKDIDIFVSDPQYLGYLSPRVNATAESMTHNFIEQGNFLKLQFAEGEIDFVASAALTEKPFGTETMLDREVRVETSSEIVAKKVWHRGDSFKARDIFDLAMVIEREPNSLRPLQPVLRDRRNLLLRRFAAADMHLRNDFAELEVLDFRRSYDECVSIVSEELIKL